MVNREKDYEQMIENYSFRFFFSSQYKPVRALRF